MQEATKKTDTLVRTEDLRKYFTVRTGLAGIVGGGLSLQAVDRVNLEVRKGEVLGLAGESGCGKTTLGKLLVRLIDPTEGKIYLDGRDITLSSGKELKHLRRQMQMVFQDPYESLNPRYTIFDSLVEPLRVHGLATSRDEEEERVSRILEDVELTPIEDFMFRYPHLLSGGQRQRVAVARALIPNPQFLVADEPVSMLDVSIRAEILNLLADMKAKYNLSLVFITHDLALARHMCDRIAIMYLGKIVEIGSAEDIVYDPLHPYTVALLQAVPDPDPEASRSKVVIKGEVPSPISPPPACRFHPRCPIARRGKCDVEEPPLTEYRPGHFAACHFAGEFKGL